MTELQGGSVFHLIRQGLRDYLRPYWREQLILVATVIPSVCLKIYMPLTLQTLLDKAIPQQDLHLLLVSLAILVGLLVLASLADLWQIFVCAGFGSELEKDLRLRLFEHIQRLPLGFFDNLQPGEMTALFARELVTLRDTYRNLVVGGLQAVLQILTAGVALLSLDWRTIFGMAVICPFIVRSQLRSVRETEVADFDEKTSDARVAYAVQDEVVSVPLVKAFGLTDATVSKFARKILGRSGPRRTINTYDRALKEEIKRSPNYLKAKLGVDVDQNTAYIIALCVGSALAYLGLVAVGQYAAMLALILTLGGALSKLTGFFQVSISAASALERVESILRMPVGISESEGAVALPNVRGEIRFENVNFGYVPPRIQIKDLSFTLPSTGIVAFLGRSGSGKSTVLKLMLRLYEVNDGRITLDGLPLSHIQLASLRGNIGVALQELVLFNGTVWDNLTLVKPEATPHEVEEATRAAEAHDSIVRLPHQYQTLVGEGGRRLSPGQRQRIALARALLSHPKVLILDEVTSSLDPEAEAAIYRTLRKLSQERLVILMTHRLAAIASSDLLMVIDKGTLAQQGNHEALLAEDGRYRQMWYSQSGFVVSSDGRHADVTTERLRAIALFEELEQEQLQDLVHRFVSEHFESGQAICQEGEEGDRFFILARGRARVLRQGHGETPVHVATLEDGDYFGEDALLDGATYSTGVEAIYPTLVLVLHRDEFHKLLDQTHAVRAAVHHTATERSLTLFGRSGRRPSRLPAVWTQIG